MTKENTLVLVKPDGLVKSLTGNILSRLSEAKLIIIGAKMTRITKDLAEQHYCQLKEQPFYDDLLKYFTGKYYHTNRILALVYQGNNAIKKIRSIVGNTNPEKASATSIRGAYGRITTRGIFENVVHASSNAEEAEREIKLWFCPDELVYEIYPVKNVIKKNVHVEIWV